MRVLSDLRANVKSCTFVPEKPWEHQGRKGIKKAHYRIVALASAMSEERGCEDVAEERLISLECAEEVQLGNALFRIFPRLKGEKVETVIHSIVKTAPKGDK